MHWRELRPNQVTEGLTIAATWNGSERQWRRIISWFLEPRTVGQFRVIFDLLAPLRLTIVDRPSCLVFVFEFDKEDGTFSLWAPPECDSSLPDVMSFVEFLMLASAGNYIVEEDC